MDVRDNDGMILERGIALIGLIDASILGRPALVRIFLERGADPNIQEENGDTALIAGSLIGNIDIVRLLLVRGADPSIRNNVGDTALSLAVSLGHTDIVELLEHHQLTRVQSRFRGRQTRKKARTQKATRKLSLAKSMTRPSTYSDNMRYEPNIANMVGERLSRMPYNPEVAARIKEEERQDEERQHIEMADYLDTLAQYGGKKRRKKTKKKRKKSKKKSKKKK